jgi:predicted hotdog family 3-hydroxylacyl-ACP dehydratase
MVLLDRVESWSGDGAVCRARSHLDPANPLRHSGRLAALCGIEYGLQAAALHGALMAGGTAQEAGYAASLRGVSLHADRLDQPAFGEIRVEAKLEARERFGMVYAFEVRSEAGALLVAGRASIALPR